MWAAASAAAMRRACWAMSSHGWRQVRPAVRSHSVMGLDDRSAATSARRSSWWVMISRARADSPLKRNWWAGRTSSTDIADTLSSDPRKSLSGSMSGVSYG